MRGPALPSADDIPIEAAFARGLPPATYGAAQADADKVCEVLEGFGFRIQEVSLPARSIRVAGTVAMAEAAFRPKLALYHSADQGDFRGREGGICVPAELDGLVTGVFGLDDRRVARRKSGAPAAVQAAAPPSVTPSDLEHRYNFPAGDAAGRQIVIAEFDGGYFQEDVAAYCAKMGRPVPHVTAVALGQPAYTLKQVMALKGSKRQDVLGASVEVMMDVEIVAGLCPTPPTSSSTSPRSPKRAGSTFWTRC